MSTRAFLGIHLSTRIVIVFPKFSSRNFSFSPGNLSQGTITWIFLKFLGFSWPCSGKVGFFYFQGPSIRFEFCLFLFHEVAKAFS